MPIRKTPFTPGEYYHLCVRGNNKQAVFLDDRDRTRMLFLTTHMQSPRTLPHIGRLTKTCSEEGVFRTGIETMNDIAGSRYVSLHAFAFMSNHIHIALREVQEGGVVAYMQRMLTAYAKYFNVKYETVGHVFQTPYRSTHVADNDQLLYLSSYIHRNPRELPGIAGKEHRYRWSSYRDYLGPNRFGRLLDPSIVLEQFEDQSDYKTFVDSSAAKDWTSELAPF